MLPCAAAALSTSALCLRRRSEFLWAMFAASALYLFANLVFAVIEMTHDGSLSFDYLFYGYRNSTFMVALPALASSLALDALAGRRVTIRTVVTCLVSLLELYIGYSATSLCAFVVVILLVLVIQRIDPYRFVNGLTVAVVYVALFVGLVVFRLQNIGEFFIQGVLGRSTTFSGRTYIWDQALTDVANGAHWLFGYGIDHSLIVSMPDGQYAFYAHNDLLQFMMIGGLLLTIVWLAFLGIVLLRLYKKRSFRLAACFSAVILGYCIIGLMECSFMNPGAFAVIALAYCWWSGEEALPSRGKHCKRRG